MKDYLQNIYIIFLKEFRVYFNSPTAYVVIIVFLLFSGWLFASPLFLNNQITIMPFINNVPLLYLFLIPAIAMRLIAEEIKVGTIEILATMPIRDYEIVLGKYFSAFALLVVCVGMTLYYPISLAVMVKGAGMDLGQVTGAYIGLILLGLFFMSMCMLASSMTKNQIVAFILGFLFCFSFFLFGKFAPLLPGILGNLFEFLGVDSHFNNLVKGVIDTRDILYFAGLSGFFVYLATIVVGSRKWR